MSKEEMVKQLEAISEDLIWKGQENNAKKLYKIKCELAGQKEPIEETPKKNKEPNWKALFLDERGEYRAQKKHDNALLEERYNRLYQREEALSKASKWIWIYLVVLMVVGCIVAIVGMGLNLKWLALGATAFSLLIVVGYVFGVIFKI